MGIFFPAELQKVKYLDALVGFRNHQIRPLIIKQFDRIRRDQAPIPEFRQ